MRLYRDRFTNRGRTQLLLLFADLAVLALVVTFAGGAWSREGHAIDTACLAVWAMALRLVSPYLVWLRKPRPFIETLTSAIALVLVVCLLFGAGIDLVWAGLDDATPPPLHAVVLIFGSWASALFLFHPPWYRVHDLALAGTLVSGLIGRQPYPIVAVVLFLVAFTVSAATRHLLHNVYLDMRRPLINLQNARAAAITTALGASLGFVGLFYFFSHWISYDAPNSMAAGGSITTSLEALEANRPESSRPESGGSANGGGTGGATSSDASSEAAQIGYTRSVRLGDLGPVRDSTAVMARVRVIDARIPWKPTSRTLLRASSMVDVDATGEGWKPRFEPEVRRWELGQVLAPPELGRKLDRSQAVEIEIEIGTPELRDLFSPYDALGYGFPDPAQAYQRTEDGSVVLHPAPVPGDRYRVRFAPIERQRAERISVLRRATGTHEDPRTLQVPDPRSCGIDFAQIATELLGDRKTIATKINALRGFFRRNGFRYALEADWRADTHRLQAFLVDQRLGDCRYFAITSALILRAAGVSTRLATGYSGLELDPVNGDYLVRSFTAHAWVEVFAPDYGWVPIDPTTWVPGDVNIPPDPDLPPSEPPHSPDTPPSADENRQPAADTSDPSDPPESPPERDPWPEPDVPPAPDEAPPDLDSDFGVVPPAIEDPWPEPGDPGDPIDPSEGEFSSEVGELGGDAPEDLVEDPEAALRAERRRLASTLLRLVVLIVVGVIGAFTVRRFLDPRRDDDELDPDDDNETFSDPIAGETAAPPQFEPTNPNERIVHHYLSLQFELSRTRRQRRSAETPAQHARRLAGSHEEADAAFREINSRLYAVLYATREMSAEDADRVAEACRVVKRAWI